MIQNILDNANCKVKNTHLNLHRWKNWEPNTPFAPIFDMPLWCSDLPLGLMYEIKNLIEINSEKYTNYKEVWKSENIFSWGGSTIEELKTSILFNYLRFMDELKFAPENNLWIRGWPVVLKETEGIGLHSHSYHENTYLSGNIMVSENATTTDYAIPHLSTYYGFYKVENIQGRMTLFPSWVQHKVDPIVDSKRISIGFDIFTEKSIEYAKQNSKDSEQESILNSVIFLENYCQECSLITE